MVVVKPGPAVEPGPAAVEPGPAVVEPGPAVVGPAPAVVGPAPVAPAETVSRIRLRRGRRARRPCVIGEPQAQHFKKE